MALAAFGTDAYHRSARDGAFELHDDGGFELTFDRRRTASCTTIACSPSARRGSRATDFTQDHFDLAWAYQDFAEEILVHVAQRSCTSAPGRRRLAMAGGVALNCVANTEILRRDRRSRSSTSSRTPATAGWRPGCALYGYHVLLGGRSGTRSPTTTSAAEPRGRDRRGARATRRASSIQRSDDIAAECAASSPTAPSSAGSRAARSSDPAPWGTAASSPTPARSTRRSGSTTRSSGASGSGPTPRASSPSTPTSTSRCSAPQPVHAARGQHPRRGARQGAGHRPRRRQRACADRRAGHRSALPPADLEVPRAHRHPARRSTPASTATASPWSRRPRTPCNAMHRWASTRWRSATTSHGRRERRRNAAGAVG